VRAIDTQLFRYSEWLDGQGLIVSDQGEGADERTHEQLVQQFLGQDSAPAPHPPVERGRVVRGYNALVSLIREVDRDGKARVSVLADAILDAGWLAPSGAGWAAPSVPPATADDEGVRRG
jgi:hypothetical protein